MSVTRVWLVLALVAVLGVGGALYVSAGRADGPVIDIVEPTRLVGRASTFEATVEAPGGNLTSLDAVIQQGDQRFPLFSLDQLRDGAIRQDASDRVRVTRQFDRSSHPELVAGEARIIVSATRPVLFGLREAASVAETAVEVRLDPPKLQIVSTLHYVNHGGSELAVYRVTPSDAESGVRVGDRHYPGYPASGAGVGGDDSLRVALFALSYDQDLTTRIDLYARDAADNEGEASFDYRIFPTEHRRSRIAVGEGFLRQVVPAIVARAPELADEELGDEVSVAELLDLYLFINGTLRESNRATVAALAEETSAQMQWDGPFRQLVNSQVESGFADYRTYLHDGDEIDQQVHLGFDLASTANAPVVAANDGTIVYADFLGIFGNCVIVDHGMGLQTLYAHLSSIDVSPGEVVSGDERLGLSGRTGLAGGDHLHFATLLHGRPVTPVEWWDSHWIEDRILRKLRAAGATAPHYSIVAQPPEPVILLKG